jgi:hypothetical protein
MTNIQLNNVRLHLRKGIETMDYGGNFDLRPTAFIEKQIFKHDIPGIYAQYVDNLSISDFSLTWSADLPDFFTDGIECNDVTNLSIRNFDGIPNPNTSKGQRVRLQNTTIKKNN